MKDRLKKIRKSLYLTQEEFAKNIELKTSNAISMIERGENALTDQNIKLICSKWNVNEEWLRYGTGEMLNKSPPDDLTPDKREFLDIYSQLYPKNQEIVLKYASMLLKDQIEEHQALTGKEAPPEKGEEDTFYATKVG